MKSTIHSSRRSLKLGLILSLISANVAAQSVESVTRSTVDLEGRAGGLEAYIPRAIAAQTRTVSYTERFADAEIMYRGRDYSHAAVLFTDIVTNYRDTPAFANALFLLGESLYEAGDRYGARSRFREVLTHANDPLFRPWIQRSLGRLIEIALRTGDVAGMDEMFSRLNQIPPGDIEAQTTYARGKYLFLRPNPDYSGARVAFESIATSAPIYPQSRYFLGAILTAQERFPEAITAFQRVTQIDPQNDQQKQQVIDLAFLAIGRLQLERSEYDAAVEAYQQVGRNSPYFDRALFEQAWAFIRAGDAIRAERALEVLAISNPDSPLIPEGKLLWGNLLLRTGRFERAQQVFTDVRTAYGPVSQRMEQIVAQTTDPQVYFQQLLLMNQVFDASGLLPQQAVAYLRTEGTLDQAISVVTDLNICRQYVRDSEELIARLNAAINSSSRAHVFRELRIAREQGFQVQNRITQARAELAAALDSAGAGINDSNLQGVISQRQGLENSIRRLPIDDAGIRRRDRAAEAEFTTVGQELQRNDQRVSNLEAMLVAMDRYLADNGAQRANTDTTGLRNELVQHRNAVVSYRARIAELRRQITAGRAQIGVGDPRYQRDLEIASEARDLLRRQADILRSANRLPAEATALMTRLDEAERRVQMFDQRVQGMVDERMSGVRSQVQEEERNVAGYRIRLADLEREAADVVGRSVMENINNVRLHFYRIVMRADLGLVDVAWEERENHNNRARILAEELNRQTTALNDEFSEVTEGAEADTSATPNARNANTPNANGSSGSSSSGPQAPSPTPSAETPNAGATPANPGGSGGR
jgi:TolA-binding protein/uncharacterized coiled-coil DUF342 family protein